MTLIKLTKTVGVMSVIKESRKIEEREHLMDTENSILVKLTEILEREHLISVEERNRAVDLIKTGGMM